MKVELKEIRWSELNRYLHEIQNIMETLKILIRERRNLQKGYIGIEVLERLLSRFNYANNRLRYSIEMQLQFGKKKGAEKCRKLEDWEHE